MSRGMFERIFTPWPQRYYVIEPDETRQILTVSWIGMPGGPIYEWELLQEYLEHKFSEES